MSPFLLFVGVLTKASRSDQVAYIICKYKNIYSYRYAKNDAVVVVQLFLLLLTNF